MLAPVNGYGPNIPPTVVMLPSGKVYEVPSQKSSTKLVVSGINSVKSKLTIESHPPWPVNVYGPYMPPAVVVLPSGKIYVVPSQKESVRSVTGLVCVIVIV